MQLSVDILFLLLPVAALSGWLIGRKGKVKNVERACQETTKTYVEGLNYLLSDEEDKASTCYFSYLKIVTPLPRSILLWPISINVVVKLSGQFVFTNT